MKEGSEVGRALPCRGGGAGHMEGRLGEGPGAWAWELGRAEVRPEPQGGGQHAPP